LGSDPLDEFESYWRIVWLGLSSEDGSDGKVVNGAFRKSYSGFRLFDGVSGEAYDSIGPQTSPGLIGRRVVLTDMKANIGVAGTEFDIVVYDEKGLGRRGFQSMLDNAFQQALALTGIFAFCADLNDACPALSQTIVLRDPVGMGNVSCV